MDGADRSDIRREVSNMMTMVTRESFDCMTFDVSNLIDSVLVLFVGDLFGSIQLKYSY